MITAMTVPTPNLSYAHLKKLYSYICIDKNIMNQCSQMYTLPLIKSEHFRTIINTNASNHLSCQGRNKYCINQLFDSFKKCMRYFLSLYNKSTQKCAVQKASVDVNISYY